MVKGRAIAAYNDPILCPHSEGGVGSYQCRYLDRHREGGKGEGEGDIRGREIREREVWAREVKMKENEQQQQRVDQGASGRLRCC